MFKIYDGRNEFYQWDLGRKLILSDPTVEEVHFCNKTSDCSLVVAVYDEDGLRLADVPNILLQTDWPINVYAYCGDGYTKTSDTFKVARRSRPDDYVYTETQVKRWEDLEKRIDDKINDLDASEAERATAENERIAAENERIAAEESRVVAEEQRNENFGTLSTDMDAAITKAEELTEGLSNYESTIINQGECITAIEAKTENHEKRITNIERHISQDYFVTDDTTAYNKAVPADVCPYAQLNSIGGMTYKSNNLIPFPYLRMNSTENGVNFSTTDDGAITLSGTSTSSDVSNIALIDRYAPITFEAGTYTFRQNRSNNDANAYMVWAAKEEGANTQYLYGDVVKTFSKKFTLWCAIQIKAKATVNTVLKPMFYKGTATLPYERYFEGLRDSKVTEILSHGANLFPILPWANRTIGGITFRLDDDGVYHLSGTATENLFTALKQNLPIGKYTLSLNCNKQIGTGFTNAVYVTARSADGEWRIVHSTHSSNTYATSTTTVDIVNVTFAIMEGVNCDGLTVAPMINRGDYIPYAPYREPISYPIPKALQDIDGYGWGINADCYNYIDYEKKQFVKRVGCLDMGTLTWNKMGSYDAWEANVSNFNVSFASGNYETFRCLHSLYSGASVSETVWNATENTVATSAAYDGFLFCCNKKSTSPTGILYYELAEPIITDISNILTDDNFLEVESGEAHEFANEHKKDVPSSITYLMKEGSI